MTSPETATQVGGEKPSPLVSLPSSAALDRAGTTALLQERGACFVLLAGEVHAGKTTIAASIYEMLRRRALKSIEFAGSRTLSGFELRCRLARIASRRNAPETPRTPFGREEFLHLELMSVAGERRRDLLMSDLSGERLQRATDSKSAAADIPGLGRADVLCILLNGSKLARHLDRTNEVQRVSLFLQRVIESECLAAHVHVQLVVSKSDLLGSAESAARAWVNGQLQSILALPFVKRFRTSAMFVAARPAPPATSFGDGVEELIQSWVAAGTHSAASIRIADASGPSQMERWGQFGGSSPT